MAAEGWLWLAVAWAAPPEPGATCPSGGVAVEQVDAWLAEAEEAFADLDIERFLARSDRVRAALPCVDRVLPSRVAARLHRSEGLRRFGERRVDSVRSFAAARALEPDYVFDPHLVPPGNPILDDYAAMDLSAADPERLPLPERGALYVDGVRTRHRARAWPAVVQLVEAGDAATLTAWVEHHQEVPSYPARSTWTPPRRRLALATGVVAASAGAAWVGAQLSHAAWDDLGLDHLRHRTNGFTVAAGVAGVAAAGLGTALVVTW